MTLEGKHALVTGGGTGIGLAIARALADQGAQVTITGRRLEVLQSVAGSGLHALALRAYGQAADDLVDGVPDQKVGRGYR